MFKVPLLQSCCLCLSLRRGTIVIAVLGIVFEISALIGVVVAKQHIIPYAEKMNASDTEEETFMSIFIEEWKQNTASEIVGAIFVLALYILLLLGVYYRHEKMFLLWLAVEGFTLIMYALGIIALPFLLPLVFPNNIGICVGIVAVFAVAFAIAIYCYLVVYAYYREMKATNKALKQGTQLQSMDDIEN